MTRTVSAGMSSHVAQSEQTLVGCAKVTRLDGTILRFTAHDEDITISGYIGVDAVLNGTYLTSAGYQSTDTTTTAALNVDNMDVLGPMQSPSITENDLNAGLWDRARIIVFSVNYKKISDGPIWHRVGFFGEIVIKVGQEAFKGEVRGLTQMYTTRILQNTTPGCRNILYDVNCKVDPLASSPNFTVFGSFTGVNPDGVTLYDTARTEPGPTGGVAITGITNANPGVVTMASGALGPIDGQLITISGVSGMPLLNVVTIARNPSGSTFQLTIDTTDTAVYGTYASGGTVDYFEGDTGYFDFGVLTILAGSPAALNAGLSREVKSYVPGQITLQEPFPYDVLVGESYKLTAGCDKSESTCFTKFSNVVNFRGEPWLQGVDKMVQVARHS